MKPKSRSAWVGAAFVALATALVFSKVIAGQFVWDDMQFLAENAAFRTSGDLLHLITQPFLNSGNYFRPLMLLMFVAQVRLLGADPHAMHAVSFLLHIANSSLVTFLLLRSLARSETSSGPAVAAAAVLGLTYAMHPAQVEPVAWISGQFDLFATFFILAALVADTGVSSAVTKGLLVSVFFLLASLCKESVATFPPALVLFHWWQVSRSHPTSSFSERLSEFWLAHRIQYVLLFFAGLLYLALRFGSLGYLIVGVQQSDSVSSFNPMASLYAFAKYLQLLVLPFFELGPLHDNPFVGNHPRVPSDLAFAAIGAITLLVVPLLLWRKRVVGLSLAIFAIALFPALLLGAVNPGASAVQERYLELPLALTLVLGGSLALLRIRSASLGGTPFVRPAAILGGLWLILAVGNTLVTIPLWRDNLTLWRWALVNAPDSDYARTNLLSRYLSLGLVNQALPLAEKIEADAGASALALLNVSSLYVQLNQLDHAEKIADAASLRVSPDDRDALYLLIMVRASVLSARGKHFEAASTFRDALLVSPRDVTAQMRLALELAAAGDVTNARSAADLAESYCVPSEREKWREKFRNALSNSAKKSD